MAEFRTQLELRQSGEIDVYDHAPTSAVRQTNGASDGWIVIDGTGKSCAGIIAALSEQLERDNASFIEVIIPDVLNSYDVLVWAEKGNHSVLTQRKDPSGAMRVLIQP